MFVSVCQAERCVWSSSGKTLYLLHRWLKHAHVGDVWRSASDWAAEAVDGPWRLVWQDEDRWEYCNVNFKHSLSYYLFLFYCLDEEIQNILIYWPHMFLSKGTFKRIVDVNLACAMGPPGGGRNPVTQRFTRHFNFLSFTEMEDASKKTIFSTILGSWMGELVQSM